MAAIERGIPYYVYNPSQSKYFALNAPSDPNFVGYVTDITGLDDAGVRENAQVVVAGDGGYHGPFWKDRRPWTISGIVLPIFPLLARDASQELMEGILSQAMVADGYLKWTPADGIARMLKFRKQQPTRVTKGQSNVQNNFQIACVTADHRVLSWNQNSLSVSGGAVVSGFWRGNILSATGVGNTDAAPYFKVTGPINSFAIINSTTAKQIKINLNVPGGGDFVVVDLTGTYPQVYDATGTSYYGSVDPLGTDWSIAVSPGANLFYLAEGSSSSTATSSTSLQVAWQDSWT